LCFVVCCFWGGGGGCVFWLGWSFVVVFLFVVLGVFVVEYLRAPGICGRALISRTKAFPELRWGRSVKIVHGAFCFLRHRPGKIGPSGPQTVPALGPSRVGKPRIYFACFERMCRMKNELVVLLFPSRTSKFGRPKNGRKSNRAGAPGPLRALLAFFSNQNQIQFPAKEICSRIRRRPFRQITSRDEPSRAFLLKASTHPHLVVPE